MTLQPAAFSFRPVWSLLGRPNSLRIIRRKCGCEMLPFSIWGDRPIPEVFLYDASYIFVELFPCIFNGSLDRETPILHTWTRLGRTQCWHSSVETNTRQYRLR